MAEATETELPEGQETEGGEGEGNEGPAPEIVSRAREMGWVEKEKFRGNPEVWVDADEFVRKGDEVLPIIRANNRRMAEQLQARDQELAQTKNAMEELRQSVKAMQAIQLRETQGRLERQINAKREQIEDARADKDTATVVKLQAELDILTEEKGKVAKPVEEPPSKKEDGPKGMSAEDRQTLETWNSENDWFGSHRIKTATATAIAAEMRRDPATKNLGFREFLEEVGRRTEEEYSSEFGEEKRPKASKVSGGSNSGARAGNGGGSTKKGKSYTDLPAEAKVACDQDVGRLVGPNKVYKTKEEYYKFYVQEYFGEAE